MRLIDILRSNVTFQRFPNPGQKSRQLLSADLVAGTADHDVAVHAEIEMRVTEPPNVEAFGFVRTLGWRRFRNDELGTFRITQAVILSAPRIELKEKNEARITRDFAIYTLRRSFRSVLAPTPDHR